MFSAGGTRRGDVHHGGRLVALVVLLVVLGPSVLPAGADDDALDGIITMMVIESMAGEEDGPTEVFDESRELPKASSERAFLAFVGTVIVLVAGLPSLLVGGMCRLEEDPTAPMRRDRLVILFATLFARPLGAPDREGITW